MEIGAVLPHNEIGTDPGALKAYAQGVEALGITHLLIYDHVLGADPDRPGGFEGPYDKDVAFPEPFTTFAFIAGCTEKLEMITTVLILPQRQTVLVAKQAAEVAILSNNRFRLGVGTGWNELEYVGLNEQFSNRGRRQAEQVELLRRLWTEDSLDYGKFKSPTLRNIELTGPYMHDGRFSSLEEVVEFYSTGLKKSPSVDPLMKNLHFGGTHLNLEEKAALVAFLKTLTDSDFITNPAFSDPGE